MRFSRRRFLQSSLGAAATTGLAGSLAAGGQAQTRSTPVRKRSVLVLGAGMAGLTAALSLLRRGHQVTVIEYQDRIGGRLLSVPLKGGQFSEAGGGHLRANMPYVLSYIRHFKLPLLTLNDGLPRYLFDGKTADAANLSRWPWGLTPQERRVGVASLLNTYLILNGLDTDTVLDANWPDAQAIQQLDNLTLAQLIRQVGGSDAFIQLLDAHGGTFTSSSPALGVIPDLAYHFGDQNLFRIQGGNDRLPKAMATAIGSERFVLGAPVVAIEQQANRVTVTVKDGRTFQGDAVISTIPFTVLPEVAVRPGWSAGKRRMFAEMEWEQTVKVIAQTRSPVWLAQNVHGWPMAGSDRPWERVIDITGNEGGGYGNTFFYLNGRNKDAMLARPKSERAQAIVDQFRADLPDLFDEVVTLADFAWGEQPWIRGSFGGPPLGGAWMIGEWTTPEGLIHFAGDFTTMKSGWVEGAIESGLRAARQIDPDAQPEADTFLRQEQRCT
ncbi:flavin monoamine oxidase family protein [Synechococcus elongatus]|uniref:NAD(P)/FAD-dependent oxidoreductase n=1 Tax=Synechococcus elongatus PCC 11801 TaxID=2219813 RepID=A0AAN1UUM3_SYNEL|nr:NAD(P)/FAD-dependent oxidoreductase [Synechococcus elongatus]AZB72733.1 amino acid oxidase [Synechococcus elongatus PCC 11801]